MADWNSLRSSSSSVAYTAENVDVSGYIFDLFATDVSLALDPSFAAAVLDVVSGFDEVDAVASMDMSASTFNNFIKITVDSSDLDNTPANDIEYTFENLNNLFANIQVSHATVKSGHTNAIYGDSMISKDLVRHIAKEITGGYAVADIFSNEAELVTDVVNQDASINQSFGDIISNLNSISPLTTDGFSGLLNSDDKRAFNIARTLFDLTVNDPARRNVLFADISNTDTSGNATTSVFLKFAVGDAIAIRVNYGPASSPVGGSANPTMGNNPISDRSYKVLIKLT